MRRTTTRVKTQITENMTNRCSRRSSRARSACSSDVPIDIASSRVSSTGEVAPVILRVLSLAASQRSSRYDSRPRRNSQPMTRSADVVVIGAGIIGCLAAYFLAADGHRVVLTDRGEVASGTAAASGGGGIIFEKEKPAGGGGAVGRGRGGGRDGGGGGGGGGRSRAGGGWLAVLGGVPERGS